MFSAVSASAFPLLSQAVLALGGVAMLQMQPADQGEMLLLPLGGQTTVQMIDFALAGSARIVAEGPTPGSLVVIGDRAPLGWALRDHGILVVDSRSAGCGRA